MATTYYQPGVYIQEVDTPQVSVQSVPTAIPVFMGYTQIAQSINPNDLHQVPTEINSLLDYVLFFGTGPGPSVNSVNLDANYNFIDADVEIQYKMYDAVRMFYLQGGGKAYIVSAGLYTAPNFSPGINDFLGDGTLTNPGCFAPVTKLQDPTLFVLPDYQLLGAAWQLLYQQALTQNGETQSTFLIGDFYYNYDRYKNNLADNVTPWTYGSSTYNYDNEVAAFRDAIGNNSLNYGAVYGPYIQILTALPITFAEIQRGKLYVGGNYQADLSALAPSGSQALAMAKNVEQLLMDISSIQAGTTNFVNTVTGFSGTILAGSLSSTFAPLPAFIGLNDLYSYIKSLVNTGSLTPVEGVQYISYFAYSVAQTVQNFLTGTPPPPLLSNSDLIDYINSSSTGLIITQFDALIDSVVQIENTVKDATGPLAGSTGLYGNGTTITVAPGPVTFTVYANSVAIGTCSGSYGSSTPTSFNDLLGDLSGGGTWVSSPGYSFANSSAGVKIVAPLTVGGLSAMTITANSTSFSTPTLTLTVSGSVTPTATYASMYGSFTGIQTAAGSTWALNPFSDTGTNANLLASFGTSVPTNLTLTLQALDTQVLPIISQYSSILVKAQSDESTDEATLKVIFPAFANIINGVNSTPIPFPPSGAMAGIYANTDNTLGVWKAPANVSINGNIGPDWTFANADYDNLNVDPVSGKSINAIRTFTGRGTLVWGARTLAGNDNNWRYVSVRRLFIMIEQSMKDALEAYVFESNDAQTWTTVIAEASAYLYDLWRAGALQGATPQQAYSVQCGLGATMTMDDILNGRMIVLIGVAAVRPAEFIILQFTQNVQPTTGS